MSPILMETVRLAFRAMATRFELVLRGDDAVGLRAAGEEVQREIRRIESCCNYYSPSSELSAINRDAASRAFRCSGMMMRILMASRDCFLATDGRFDPSVAPALAHWGLRHPQDSGRVPSDAELDDLRSRMGFEHVVLNEDTQTVRFLNANLKLDFGGLAKGWALDEALLLLQESGVEHALLHGGTSTAIAWGCHEDDHPWTIGIEDPYDESAHPSWLATVQLDAGALSVSGVNGKSFVDAAGLKAVEYGHIIDPCSGRAVSGPRLAVALGSSAAACDAWSTALLAAPNESVPAHVRGTAFLKTDSGWTVTAGKTDLLRFSPESLPPSDSLI